MVKSLKTQKIKQTIVTLQLQISSYVFKRINIITYPGWNILPGYGCYYPD